MRREAKEKSYADGYNWADPCEDGGKMKKLRVPEPNKYLKRHKLDRPTHKDSKKEKMHAVIRHWHLQKHAAERTDRQRARDAVHNVHVALQDQEDEDEDDDHDHDDDDYNSFDSEDENDNDVLESEGNGDSNNSILPVTGDRDVTKPHSYNTLMKSDKQKISNCSDPENVFYVKISFS